MNTPNTALPNQLVRYACGCVGFPPESENDHGEGIAALIQTCDAENHATYRPMRRKGAGHAFEPVSAADCVYWQAKILEAFSKAYSYDELKKALAPLVREVNRG